MVVTVRGRDEKIKIAFVFSESWYFLSSPLFPSLFLSKNSSLSFQFYYLQKCANFIFLSFVALFKLTLLASLLHHCIFTCAWILWHQILSFTFNFFIDNCSICSYIPDFQDQKKATSLACSGLVSQQFCILCILNVTSNTLSWWRISLLSFDMLKISYHDQSNMWLNIYH